jgi:chaperonin cofactor prefoldin
MLNTKPYPQRRSGHSHVVGLIIILVSAILALWLLANRQQVLDQVSVWQYKPSGDIVRLAERSGMNDTGKFYYYASQPKIEEAATFNKDCGTTETSTAILGCYNGRNIFIYNVTNPQLDGIKETTAAHEMLHAAYARLSSSDKQHVDKLLKAEYQKLKGDKDFAARMAFYDKTEPGERDNELHSVIGTEVGSIDAELEQYYSRYFQDRSKVITLHNNYASVFANLQQQSDTLSSQLTTLGDTINQQTKEYNADVAALSADINTFNQRANSGDFSSKAAFDSERASLVARVSQLDQMRETINGEIAQYNSLRNQLQAVASESQALNQSIDSSLAPAPSL